MADQVIAPIIPSLSTDNVQTGRNHGNRPTRSPLPLAELVDAMVNVPGVVYGMGRIDASGRIADRTVTLALGWRSGDRLTVAAAQGVVIARRDPAGVVTLGGKPYVMVPAALRYQYGLQPGDRVLLAATPTEDLLAVYPLIKVHQAICSSLSAQSGESR